MTANSIKSDQTNRGLFVDGITGGATWTKLMFTSISYCGMIHFGFTSNEGFRIDSEPCGGDIQRGGADMVVARAYNKTTADP